MTKTTPTVMACATLLWAGTALATTTPQQNCDNARITAWKVYQSCVDVVLAKDGKCFPDCPPSEGPRYHLDEFASFAKCRHAYFKKWPSFRLRASSLAGSTCTGSRFTDNGTTVADNLTGLVWEKKTNDASVHDVSNSYTWSTGSNNEDGATFTSFLGTLNGGGGFAGANGWRLPTLVELQTIELDFACTSPAPVELPCNPPPTCSCASTPCIDGTFGPTQSNVYWSATSYVPTPSWAWNVEFDCSFISNSGKTDAFYVRAVRGGL